MLFIIHPDALLYSDVWTSNLLLFRGYRSKGEVFCRHRPVLLVFLLFFQAGIRVPRRCRELFNPADEALVTPGEWERAPLIESSGRSTVLIPVEVVAPELAGRVWGFR